MSQIFENLSFFMGKKIQFIESDLLDRFQMNYHELTSNKIKKQIFNINTNKSLDLSTTNNYIIGNKFKKKTNEKRISQFLIVIDLELLLAASGRIRDVKLQQKNLILQINKKIDRIKKKVGLLGFLKRTFIVT